MIVDKDPKPAVIETAQELHKVIQTDVRTKPWFNKPYYKVLDDNSFQVYFEEAQASWKQFSAAKFTMSSGTVWNAEAIRMPQHIFEALHEVFKETLIVLRNRKIDTIEKIISEDE